MGKNFQSVIWNCFKQVPLSKNVICTIEKCTKKILRNDFNKNYVGPYKIPS